VVLSLIILVLLGGAIFWRFSQQQKANKNQLSDTVDKNTVNPATEEQKDDASITEASEKEA
jgi:uncharacterized protein HemX